MCEKLISRDLNPDLYSHILQAFRLVTCGEITAPRILDGDCCILITVAAYKYLPWIYSLVVVIKTQLKFTQERGLGGFIGSKGHFILLTIRPNLGERGKRRGKTKNYWKE